MNAKKIIIAVMILFSLVYTTSAVSPFFFKGYAFVNGTTAPNSTIVEVFVNNQTNFSAILGQGPLGGTVEGTYTISFEANTGDNVTFRVNGVPVMSMNGTNISQQRVSSIVVEGFNLSINKSDNAAACIYASGCSGGYCVHGLCRSASTHCGDGFCDSGESSSTCSSDCGSSSTSTSSGGGGGGGGSTTSAVEETRTISSGSAGSTVTVDITKTDNLAVDEIQLTLSKSISSASVTVKESSAPSSVAAPILPSEGSVYKYMEITKTNINDTDLSKAKIKFIVTKTWLSQNNINRNKVALNRLVGSTWVKLSTLLSSENSTHIFYEAETPGFSTFAVTGEKEQAVAVKPQIKITYPANGQVIKEKDVLAKFSLTNLKLVPVGSAVKEGEGHLHVFLDGGSYVLVESDSYLLRDVQNGIHSLKIEAHKSDHSDYFVSDSVTFEVSVPAAEEKPIEKPIKTEEEKQDYSTIITIIAVIAVLAIAYLHYHIKPKKAKYSYKS